MPEPDPSRTTQPSNDYFRKDLFRGGSHTEEEMVIVADRRASWISQRQEISRRLDALLS